MLEALASGTSSESESDSPDESHSKDSSDSTVTSPVKTNPIESSTSENSNSSSDVPLSKLLVNSNSSTKRSGTLSELKGSISTTAKSPSGSKKTNATIGKNSDSNKKKEVKPLLASDTEENVDSSNSKPKVCNELQDTDENSNSSDLPLSKFIPKREQEVANNNAETKSKKKSTFDEDSSTLEENSDSDSPLPKSSGKKKKELVPKSNIKRKGSGLQSKSPKIQRKLASSSDSDSDELIMNEKSLTTNKDECKFPNSDSKGTKQSPPTYNRPGPASSKQNQSAIKQSEDSKKKTSLKRKRSGESDSEQLSKIKRKLEISSDSDDNVDEKKSTRKSTDSSLNDCDKSTKPCPASKKNKLVSMSSKKKFPSDDDGNTTPAKKEPISDRKIGKLSEGKNKKLDDSDILQKLEDSSDQSSSEESEAELQEIEKKESTNSNKTSKEPKKSRNNKKKLKAVKKVITESESEISDNVTQTKSNDVEMESANSSTSSDDDSSNTQDKIKKKPENKSAKNDSQKESKKKIGENPRILRLQRYLKEAGIRVQNYKTLWDGCKSDKARAEKLMDLLRERGLKGKPSVSECRKLKRKYEREKEISELNTSNIISTKGRSRRGAANPFASRRSPSPADNTTKEKQNYPECKQVFVRLRKIVDSEDSD